jgi:hypothetical protein
VSVPARFLKPWARMSRKTGSLSLISNGVYVCGLSNREDLH